MQSYLDGKADEKLFVRLHPEWYRRLGRAPWELNRLKPEADLFYGRTFGQRMDRMNQRAGVLSMLMSMAQAMTSTGNENKTEN